MQMNTLIDREDWQYLDHVEVETGYEAFKGFLYKVSTECIPRLRRFKSRKNIYMTSKALRMKRQKKQLWQKYVCSQSPLDRARFNICRNRLRGLTRKLRRNFESQLVSELNTNPKAFWRYSNSRLKTKATIGDLRNESGVLESGNKARAEILNNCFQRAFTQEQLPATPVLSVGRELPELSDVIISPEAVKLKLQALDPTSTPGPDGIHPRVLQGTRHSICTPLAHLYRRSLDTGELPGDWTIGRIVPIFKNGDRHDPGNYRPVSLMSITCKVLESLI